MIDRSRCPRRLPGVLLSALAVLLAAAPTSADEAARAALRHAEDHVALTLHATGVQIYECRAGAAGALEWAFQAPEADLFLDGERVGHHFAGPTWEFRDGSRITGKVVAKADGARAGDIPWLRLAVASHAGAGAFGNIDTVIRADTEGGFVGGACVAAGAVTRAPYRADYLFIGKP